MFVGAKRLLTDAVRTGLGVAIFLVVFERRLERMILAGGPHFWAGASAGAGGEWITGSHTGQGD